MAADSRMTEADAPARCDKLFLINGRIVGVAGEDAPTAAYLEFFRGGEQYHDKFDFEDGSALVLCPKRGLLLYNGSQWPDRVRERFFAIGSGAGVALGAMQLGASAAGAVRAAIRWNVFCGAPVRTMRLERVRNPR